MHLRHDGICNDLFITQSMPSSLVKFFSKMVNVRGKSRVSCFFFDSQVVATSSSSSSSSCSCSCDVRVPRRLMMTSWQQ